MVAKHTQAAPSRRSRSTTTRASSRRQAILEENVGLVHHVARQLAGRLSTAAELDELVSAGSIGLVQAADAFDPARGLSFSTFAVPRIRGAILDELRRQDHLSRGVRRQTRDLARARETLSASLGRVPTTRELALHMATTPETVRQWELDAESATVCSLDQPLRSDPFGASLADAVPDEGAVSIEDLLTREQEVSYLKEAIAALKEQERTVLALNYFEELKLSEIAEVLGVSVCRVSQIRTAALAKLRVALSDLRAA